MEASKQQDRKAQGTEKVAINSIFLVKIQHKLCNILYLMISLDLILEVCPGIVILRLKN